MAPFRIFPWRDNLPKDHEADYNQVVIVPVGFTAKTTDEERTRLNAEIEGLVTVLQAAGIRVENDQREGQFPESIWFL